MKFRVYRSSIIWHGKPCEGAYKETDDPEDDNWYIGINNLDQLREVQEKVRCSIIINFNPPFLINGCDGWIEIYDSYRE